MLIALIKTLRPAQWTKNGFVFVPLVFDEKLFQIEPLSQTLAGFLMLCLISGTVYLINDLVDIEKDRQHPTKCNRPLASGKLSKPVATTTAILIPVIVLPLSFALDLTFGLILTGYLLLQIAYSWWFKHQVIIDVMVIAAGFVLRVAAGVPLVQAERFSPWLYVFTTLLALFLALGKRRQEIVLLKSQASNTRAILDHYSLPFLDEMMAVVTAGTVMTYALYTFSAPNLPQNHTMMLSIPFVIYGIFRYLYVIHIQGNGGAPDEVLLTDRPLQVAVGLFGLAVVAILYLS
ncbi:MAG: decaprenyl-phosphate phosphoribosyltransferase [Anaerolineales bacterium]|nr:MAG: decaprenyl-phosphate phosphoribosyltransferase [Anaerolineales bacterium]